MSSETLDSSTSLVQSLIHSYKSRGYFDALRQELLESFVQSDTGTHLATQIQNCLETPDVLTLLENYQQFNQSQDPLEKARFFAMLQNKIEDSGILSNLKADIHLFASGSEMLQTRIKSELAGARAVEPKTLEASQHDESKTLIKEENDEETGELIDKDSADSITERSVHEEAIQTMIPEKRTREEAREKVLPKKENETDDSSVKDSTESLSSTSSRRSSKRLKKSNLKTETTNETETEQVEITNVKDLDTSSFGTTEMNPMDEDDTSLTTRRRRSTRVATVVAASLVKPQFEIGSLLGALVKMDHPLFSTNDEISSLLWVQVKLQHFDPLTRTYTVMSPSAPQAKWTIDNVDNLVAYEKDLNWTPTTEPTLDESVSTLMSLSEFISHFSLDVIKEDSKKRGSKGKKTQKQNDSSDHVYSNVMVFVPGTVQRRLKGGFQVMLKKLEKTIFISKNSLFKEFPKSNCVV